MGIQIETFEAAPIGCGTQPELEEIQSPEAQALIEALELTGQQNLIRERDTGDGDTVATVNPYRRMTLEEERVYRAICPAVSRLERFDAGPIPLRVLQLAAHAKTFFSRLEVWHSELHVIEDPVLVGRMPNPERSWEERIYLLARWGATLLPFEELRVQAATRIAARWRPEIEREIRALGAFRELLEAEIGGYLAGSTRPRDFALNLA